MPWRSGKVGVLIGALVLAGALAAVAQDAYEADRRALLSEIEDDAVRTSRETGRREFDVRVLEALGRVPREEFVPPDLRRWAYANRPLPIGYGQTISQPYIVALMTDLLEVEKGSKVLEVGTGSGYQAAVLAELGCKVYSIEIIPDLAREVRERLDRLGYERLETRVGDGYDGWEEKGPFDAIIVTAAAGHVPPPLVRQLADDGRMVIPVGDPFRVQQLVLVTLTEEGGVQSRQILPVAFVPLTGGH